MEQAARLPGGVYNYGSENSLSMYDTALALLRALGLEDRAEALLSGTDQQRCQPMDGLCPHTAAWHLL